MNRLAKTLFLTAAAVALTLSSIGAASADDWRRHRYHHGNDALVGGAVGLATGLIVGSAIANSGPRYIDPPYEPDYYEPAPVYGAPVYRAPPPRYYPAAAGLEPWTPQWERYCAYRYRSFDPRSGTYIGYDNRSHFCTAG
ncbi:BA14K family protein [Rhizobium sp. S152]|uniref:BA14K family protein n=1 Tax=Rhizobium sp. S152 TaxID=3055038 RepID=UPI0025A949C2|nr:BA14K family protein [Rhizobium sp. S152]MDM9628803.1 BA14K family protein [Rhizobium sp. S152]